MYRARGHSLTPRSHSIHICSSQGGLLNKLVQGSRPGARRGWGRLRPPRPLRGIITVFSKQSANHGSCSSTLRTYSEEYVHSAGGPQQTYHQGTHLWRGVPAAPWWNRRCGFSPGGAGGPLAPPRTKLDIAAPLPLGEERRRNGSKKRSQMRSRYI